ncbi:HNH endonuclease [Natrinema sp. H-ect4]
MGDDMGRKELEVHHIVSMAVPKGTHRVTNLCTLCKDGHDVIPTV